MDRQRFVTLNAIPVSLKITYTMTLLVLGVGYLFAMVQTYDAHAMHDGKPSMSPADLIIAYSGKSGDTRLESAIKGTMSSMLHEDDRAAIIDWIQQGATIESYTETVEAIVAEHCTSCHDGSNPHIMNLAGYDNLKSLVEIDTGMDFKTLIRVSHIHLFGMTFIFYLTSTIFCRASLRNVWFKRAVIALPFAAILTDIFSWYLTKLHPSFAYVVFASGGLLALCFSIQWFVSIYQMWFSKAQTELTV